MNLSKSVKKRVKRFEKEYELTGDGPVPDQGYGWSDGKDLAYTWYRKGYLKAQEKASGAAKKVLAEAYQIVGDLLNHLQIFDTLKGQAILDNLSQEKLVHKDILPWRTEDIIKTVEAKVEITKQLKTDNEAFAWHKTVEALLLNCPFLDKAPLEIGKTKQEKV